MKAPYPEHLKVVREYFAGKSPAAAEKFFWKNSLAAYRWVKRDRSQPGNSPPQKRRGGAPSAGVVLNVR
jgi:hypothetical protein